MVVGQKVCVEWWIYLRKSYASKPVLVDSNYKKFGTIIEEFFEIANTKEISHVRF